MNRFLSVFALVVLLPTAAMAQHPQTREGFGISFGLGAGSAGFCDGCDALGGTDLSSYLRLGGYVTPSLFLAGESSGWLGNGDTFSASSIGALMAVAQWYPMLDQGLYLKAGLGFSYATIATDPSTSGFAGSIGAGYDWRIGRNFALTPFINYLQQFGGSYTYSSGGGGDGFGDANVHLFQFGLGFTWF